MSKTELAEHQAAKWGRNYAESDDGYSDMAAEERRGWRVIASWGSDGWDLGHWPYVMFYVRTGGWVEAGQMRGPVGDGVAQGPPPPGEVVVLEAVYELLEIVEGDRTLWRFAAEEDRAAALDYLFLWYAAHEERRWSPVRLADREALEAGTLAVDEKFRGPYRDRQGVTL
jgi:hypothetical protein